MIQSLSSILLVSSLCVTARTFHQTTTLDRQALTSRTTPFALLSRVTQQLKHSARVTGTRVHARDNSRAQAHTEGAASHTSRRTTAIGIPVAAAGISLGRSSRADDISNELTNAPFLVEMEVQINENTKQPVVIEIHPEWAPKGVERFKQLIQDGFYDGCRFFRVVDGFVVQFGINEPELNKKYRKSIADDPVKQSNVRGTLTFATSGPNSRTTQLFVNLGDNTFLDKMGFAPIGKVVGDGMGTIDRIYGGYGEGAPRGSGPDQGLIQRRGNDYLQKNFPKLSYISRAAMKSE